MVNYWIHLKAHNKRHPVKKVFWKKERIKKIVLAGLVEYFKYIAKN